MKKALLVILGIWFALAGCAGGKSGTLTTAPAHALAAASASASEVGSSGLPIYPGAIKVRGMQNLRVIHCGHTVAGPSYQVNTDVKTVVDWYSARIPRGIRCDHHMKVRTVSMTAITIMEPGGAHAVSIVQATVMNSAKSQPVIIGLETNRPAFSASELRTMQAFSGLDPEAKRHAIAQMKAKCGPHIDITEN